MARFSTRAPKPRHLDNALAAVAAALDGYREAKAPFYIDKAERLQSKIFSRKTFLKNRTGKA